MHKKHAKALKKKCDVLRKRCDNHRVMYGSSDSEACERLMNILLQSAQGYEEAANAGKELMKINDEVSFLLEYTIERTKKEYKK